MSSSSPSSSILDLFPVIDGIHTIIAVPEGYAVDFDHPRRDTETMTKIYWCFGAGLILSTLFLSQNLYMKFYVDRKLDASSSKYSMSCLSLPLCCKICH